MKNIRSSLDSQDSNEFLIEQIIQNFDQGPLTKINLQQSLQKLSKKNSMDQLILNLYAFLYENVPFNYSLQDLEKFEHNFSASFLESSYPFLTGISYLSPQKSVKDENESPTPFHYFFHFTQNKEEMKHHHDFLKEFTEHFVNCLIEASFSQNEMQNEQKNDELGRDIKKLSALVVQVEEFSIQNLYELNNLLKKSILDYNHSMDLSYGLILQRIFKNHITFSPTRSNEETSFMENFPYVSFYLLGKNPLYELTLEEKNILFPLSKNSDLWIDYLQKLKRDLLLDTDSLFSIDLVQVKIQLLKLFYQKLISLSSNQKIKNDQIKLKIMEYYLIELKEIINLVKSEEKILLRLKKLFQKHVSSFLTYFQEHHFKYLFSDLSIMLQDNLSLRWNIFSYLYSSQKILQWKGLKKQFSTFIDNDKIHKIDYVDIFVHLLSLSAENFFLKEFKESFFDQFSIKNKLKFLLTLVEIITHPDHTHLLNELSEVWLKSFSKIFSAELRSLLSESEDLLQLEYLYLLQMFTLKNKDDLHLSNNSHYLKLIDLNQFVLDRSLPLHLFDYLIKFHLFLLGKVDPDLNLLHGHLVNLEIKIFSALKNEYFSLVETKIKNLPIDFLQDQVESCFKIIDLLEKKISFNDQLFKKLQHLRGYLFINTSLNTNHQSEDQIQHQKIQKTQLDFIF